MTIGKRGGEEKRCEGVKENRMKKNGEQEENLEEREDRRRRSNRERAKSLRKGRVEEGKRIVRWGGEMQGRERGEKSEGIGGKK